MFDRLLNMPLEIIKKGPGKHRCSRTFFKTCSEGLQLKLKTDSAKNIFFAIFLNFKDSYKTKYRD